jgi:PAS domain S-box-containing protein
MHEVSCQTAALVVDSLEHRGIDVDGLLAGMSIDRARLLRGEGRIDWEEWVEMLDRAERAVGGPDAMMNLFVSGAGARTGHPFVRLARSFLTLHDLYRLFAMWGLSRTLGVVQARFVVLGVARARFSVTIDRARVGSAPTMRFTAGILRDLPRLQGLDEAAVEATVSSHDATFLLALPRERSLVSRVRRVVGVLGGTLATLEELEEQTHEIATKNAQLVRQLSAQRAVEASLREREEWLDLALEAGRVAIWSFEPQSGVLRTSAGLPRLLGQGDAGQLPDLPTFVDCAHPDDRELLASGISAAIDGAASLDVTHRVSSSDGVEGWVRNKATVLPADEGRPLRIVGTITDVTDQRRLESRLDMAGRFIATGTLAAGVAHEINNPLAYVSANAELLLQEMGERGSLDPTTARESLEEMAHGLRRIRDVVRDLRMFSRAEELPAAEVELDGVCRAAIRMASHTSKYRATIVTDFAEVSPRVLANETRLGQVLVNLLVNAAQAMPERPTAENLVTVRTRCEGDLAVLEVADNGTGIAPEILRRVFDPFFTTKPIGEGSGLGLAVCQGIVSALGGTLDVASQLGRGSTFRVSLPRLRGGARAASSASAPRALRPRLRVLVVDDEDFVRRATTKALGFSGMDVLEASGGEEAIAIARSDPSIDVIVCDLTMPGVDGIDAFEALVADEPAVGKKFLFVSGGAVNERAREFLEAPRRRYLEKPFDLGRLVEMIGEVAGQGVATDRGPDGLV